MTDRLEISGESKEKIQALRMAAYNDGLAEEEAPSKWTEEADAALESHIAELEKVAEAAEVVDWYVHSPGAIKNELLEAIAAVSGVHVNHLLALHDALKAVEHTPESPAVSASPSGGD